MDSGYLGKVEKAKRYAEQRDRFHFHSFTVTMEGENNPHTVKYEAGHWECDCSFFRSRNLCSHTMALEIIFRDMLPKKPPVN